MVSNQPGKRTLHNCPQTNTQLSGNRLQLLPVIPGDGAKQMNRVRPIVILHHVAGKEFPETVVHQTTDRRFFYMPDQERRQTCQKTVRERLPVNLVRRTPVTL